MSWRVDECCCGCSLRTGSISIGVGNAVYNGVCLIVTIVLTAKFLNDDPTDSSEERHDTIVANSINIAGMVMNIIFNYLLVYGVRKEKPALIRCWVFYTVLFVAGKCVLSLIIATMSFSSGDTQQGTFYLFSVVQNLALQGYFVVVVKSYLEEVQGSRDSPELERSEKVVQVTATSS